MIISIPFTFTVGAVIVASQHNSNFQTIYNDYNGNITTDNLAANAAIADTQLAQISTASKVSGAAFTGLSSIPSGAGLIPVANLDTGTTANKIVILDGSAKLSAIDGSALTNLISSILDYGTSASSSTTKAIGNLKIAYGIVSVGATNSQAISNLVFTSSSSYVVQLTYATNTTVNEDPLVTYTSGAAFTIFNTQGQTRTIAWLAIGT